MKPKFPTLLAASVLFVCLHGATGAATFDIASGTTTDQATDLGGSESVVKQGAGTLRLTADQSFTGSIAHSAGTTILYGDSSPSSISVSNGTLMIGGLAGGADISLGGGTLKIGAQRSTTISSFGNPRGHILGHTDSDGAGSHFALVSGHYFYSQQRAINQGQAQNVIDLGVPTNGLITSALKPDVAFKVAVNGLDAANVNSNEGNAWRALNLQAADQMRYASVDLLVSSRGNIGGMFVRTRWDDNTTTGTGQNIPAMPNALTSNANTAFSGGVVATNGTTFDPNTLMHMHHYTQHIDPTKTLSAVEFVRIGASPTGTGLAFATSGLAINESSTAFNSNISVTADSTLDLAGAAIVDGAATLTGQALNLNSAKLTLTRTINNATGYRANFTGGALTGTGEIEIANSTGGGTGTVVISGALTGSGGITKSGPGNLGLGGNNNYDGATVINAGTVWLNSATGLGSTAGGTTLNGGTLYLLSGAHSATIGEALTIGGASTLQSGNALSYSLSGVTSLAANLTVNTDADTIISHSGDISGSASIVKTGAGTLALSGNNTFGSGTLTFGNGTANRGFLRLSSDAALGGHDKIALTGNQGGISGIQLEGGISVAQALDTRGRNTAAGYVIRNLSGDNAWNGKITIIDAGGGYAFLSDAGTLTLGGDVESTFVSNFAARGVSFSGDGSFNVTGNLLGGGPNSENLAVTMNGSGTLTLGGTNTYTGNTSINSGTLALSSTASLGNTSTTIGGTATLTGGGSFGGAVAVNGTHAPGFSPGSQTFEGGLTYGESSTLEWELIDNTTVGRGTNYDAVNVTGGSFALSSLATLDLSFSGAVDFLDVFWLSSQQWLVIDLDGATAADSNLFTLGSVTGGLNYSQTLGNFGLLRQPGSTTQESLYLTWTPVPEPGCALLCGLSAMALLRRRR